MENGKQASYLTFKPNIKKMISRTELKKIMPYLWEIPLGTRPGMLVPAQIYALEEMIDSILNDNSVEQLIHVSMLPGIMKAAMVMPDVHQGYGFPIGGIAAMRWPDGVISPGGIGYDINCGVRLLRSQINEKQISSRLEELSVELYKEIPSGIGKGGQLTLDRDQLYQVLKKGALWAVENGYGDRKDLQNIESGGVLDFADPQFVSEHAFQRGFAQLGTIGSGNHFVEVDRVEEIYDEETAKAFQLYEGQIVILIHTGSRGLGHQVATDYIRIMQTAMSHYGLKSPDRELACVPFDSKEGQEYFKAMCAAANFAWCNREVITWEIRNAWKKVLGDNGGNLDLLYDVAHNIAKIEEHRIDSKIQKVIVHRKGATRAFGPGNKEIPAHYLQSGQPVLIPGSMGTNSYVLAGTAGSEDLTFGSCCHGAGRRLSRTAAKKQVEAVQLKKKLQDQGIYIQSGSFRGLAEEAPIAYKDVNLVVETVQQAGIAKKVAKLKPLAVIKG